LSLPAVVEDEDEPEPVVEAGLVLFESEDVSVLLDAELLSVLDVEDEEDLPESDPLCPFRA
jgi:hypothetical protein